MDYLSKKPLSRRSSQRSNRPISPRSSRFARQGPPKKLNFAHIEDPLLALVAAANNAMPMTPPPEEPTFQNIDPSAKLPDTPMADQFFEDDDLESVHSEPEFDVETTHLVTHAKVYAIAEKYVPPSFTVYFATLFFFASSQPLACGIVSICACRFASHGFDAVHRTAFSTADNPAIGVISTSTTPITAPGARSPCHIPHCALPFSVFSLYDFKMDQ